MDIPNTGYERIIYGVVVIAYLVVKQKKKVNRMFTV